MLFHSLIPQSTDNMCSQYVLWDMLVNKYYTLTRYYAEAKFIRFILPEQHVMPSRRYYNAGTHNIPLPINIFREVRILNAGFNDKKIFIDLLIKEFLNSK